MSGNEESATSAMLAGRYRMGELIGRGGMGSVWLAEDTVIGRPVAIKEVRLPDGLPEAERAVLSERVMREARTAGRLSDAGIVTVYDVVFSGGRSYIVMEYVPARTLAEIVQAEGPLPPDRVVGLAEQVLAGLDFAHAAGVVHRDVKPSNILVTADGRVKLTDFGIAQAVDDPRLTSSGALIGSPAFMAPERISEGSRGGVTPASDLWSLGATLFQAVEGRPPFERGNTAATLHAIMTEVPYLSRCAGPLASVIMGLLVVNPAGRLTSAQAHGLLARAVERPAPTTAPPGGGTLVAGPPSTARYDGPPPTLRGEGPPVTARSGGRTGLVVVAAIVVLAAAFAGGVVADRALSTSGRPGNWVAPLTYGSGGQIPLFGLDSGQCDSGQIRAGRRFPSETVVDCGQPHDFEVFGEVAYDTDAKIGYPGYDELAADAQSSCTIDFDNKQISVPDRASALKYTAVVPSAKSWGADRSTDDSDSDDADRSIYCILYRSDNTQLSHPVATPTD